VTVIFLPSYVHFYDCA